MRLDFGLSIVIPSIGNSPYLDEAIESALASAQEAEVIVSMNADTNAAFRPSKYWTDSRVIWKLSGSRLPLHQSLNFAASHASCSWLYILSDDDVILPGFFDRPDLFLPDYSCLYAAKHQNIDESGSKGESGKHPSAQLFRGGVFEQMLGDAYRHNLGLFVFSKAMFDEIGGFEDTGYPNGYFVDVIFHLKLAARALQIWNEQRIVFHRRESSFQGSSKFFIGAEVNQFFRVMQNGIEADETLVAKLRESGFSPSEFFFDLKKKRAKTEIRKMSSGLTVQPWNRKLALFTNVLFRWHMPAAMKVNVVFWVFFYLTSRLLPYAVLNRLNFLNRLNRQIIVDWILYFEPNWLSRIRENNPRFLSGTRARLNRLVTNLATTEPHGYGRPRDVQVELQKFRNSRLELATLKSSRSSEPGFIIANGPSLTLDDIEKIAPFTTIASNKIFLLFDKTAWRPSHFTVVDSLLWPKIAQASQLHNLTPIIPNTLDTSLAKKCLIVNALHDSQVKDIRFSEDFSVGAFDKLTVTIFNLQLAWHLRLNPIYLIGLDHDFQDEIGKDGLATAREGVVNHFSPQYREIGEKYIPAGVPQMEWGYRHAMEFFARNNVEVINVSRKSKLDVFPRANLDEVLLRHSERPEK